MTSKLERQSRNEFANISAMQKQLEVILNADFENDIKIQNECCYRTKLVTPLYQKQLKYNSCWVLATDDQNGSGRADYYEPNLILNLEFITV